MKYRELKEKHQKEVNDFPIGFAFSNEQFKEQMEKLGLTENDTDKVVGIGASGFIRKTDTDAFIEMMKRHDKEMKDAMMSDDEFLFTAFRYELSNYEYCITGDPTDTFKCLNLNEEEVFSNERMRKIFFRAKKDYLDNVNW